MTYVEMKSEDSIRTMMKELGSKKCPHSKPRNTVPIPETLRFYFNTLDQEKSLCTGDLNFIPICRECPIKFKDN